MTANQQRVCLFIFEESHEGKQVTLHTFTNTFNLTFVAFPVKYSLWRCGGGAGAAAHPRAV